MRFIFSILFLLTLTFNSFATDSKMNSTKIDRDKLLDYPIYSQIQLEDVDMGTDHTQNIEDVPVTNPKSLEGKKIAILAAHGITESEFTFPYDYLIKRGAQVEILSPWWIYQYQNGKVHLSRFLRPTYNVSSTGSLKDAANNNTLYDAIIIPGGAWASIVLRQDPDALQIVKNHYQNKRIIAAVCSGPQVLLETDFIADIELTASSSIKTDIIRSGAKLIDSGVHQFKNIISAKGPADMSPWMKMIEESL